MFRYVFVGEVSLPKENAKRPFVRSFQKNGRQMKSLSIGIKTSRTNMGFLELFGSQQDVIKAYDTENNPIDIEWNDRKDPEVVSHVRSSSQYYIHLGPGYEEQRFISPFDVIEYLEENLPSFTGILQVSGQARHNFYNGRSSIVYSIKNITAKPEGTKTGLAAEIDYFYTQGDIERNDADKCVYYNGYVQEYISKDDGQKFVQTPIVYHFEEDNGDGKGNKRTEYVINHIKAASKNKVYRMLIRCHLKNGTDDIEFDETQLTDDQKEAIELGLATLDDFRPRGQIFGPRVSELRVQLPILRGEYVDGPVDTDMKMSEFEDSIYTPPTVEKIEDVIPFKEDKKAESKPANGYGVDPDSIDDDDLF